MSWCSPISCLVFVVCIKQTSIKNEWLPSIHISGSVFVPQVSLNATRLDTSPITLEWLKKLGMTFPKLIGKVAKTQANPHGFLHLV